jgi:hypothetical protein
MRACPSRPRAGGAAAPGATGTAFSGACADQGEKDHAALERAVWKGTVMAVFDEDR